MLTEAQFAAALHGYMAAALWCSYTDDHDPLDLTYTSADIDQLTRDKMAASLATFLANVTNEDVYQYLMLYGHDMLGHDLWLTQTRQGSGFWSRSLRAVGERLTQAALAIPAVTLVVSAGKVTS